MSDINGFLNPVSAFTGFGADIAKKIVPTPMNTNVKDSNRFSSILTNLTSGFVGVGFNSAPFVKEQILKSKADITKVVVGIIVLLIVYNVLKFKIKEAIL